MEKKNMRKRMLYMALGVLLLTAFDQLTKWLAVMYLKEQEALVLWDGVFELRYLENHGAAFGLLQGKRFLFLLLVAVILILIPYIYARIPAERHFLYLRVSAVVFLAGALGNAIDRLLHGYVIDFFYFSLIDFPIFNVADIYVTVVLVVLIFLVFFYYSEEDFNRIFSK